MSSIDRYAVVSVIGTTGAMHVWHSTDGNPRRVATGATIPGTAALATLYNGARLLALAHSKGGGTTIATYDTSRSSGGPAARCGAPETSLLAITASHGHAFLAAGGASGRIYLWAASCGTLLAAFDAHLTAVTRLTFLSDDSLLLSAGDDGAVHAWCVSSLVDLTRDRSRAVSPRISLRGHSLSIRALAAGFGGCSARVVTASVDRSVRIWHLGSGMQTGHIVLPCAPVEALLASHETVVYVGLENGDVVVVYLSTLSRNIPMPHTGLPRLRAPPGAGVIAVSAMRLAPSGKEVVVGYSDGLVRVYDAASQVLVRTYGKHTGGASVTALAVLFPVPDTLLDARHAVDVFAADKIVGKKPVADIDVSAIGTEYAALAATAHPPPTLAKIEHAGMSVGYSAAVSFCGVRDSIAEVWNAIDKVAGVECREGWADEVVRGGDGGVQGRNEEVPSHVVKELEMLRSRNRQLEEAGKKLCDVLDASGQWRT